MAYEFKLPDLGEGVREGDDVTLIAYGGMVAVAEEAAAELEASAEVVDVRTLKPLDEETLLASVAKTRLCVMVLNRASTPCTPPPVTVQRR